MADKTPEFDDKVLDTLREQERYWEAMAAEAKERLPRIRAALAAYTGDHLVPPVVGKVKAIDLVAALLDEVDRPMSEPEIRERINANGHSFQRQTVNLALRNLVEEGRVEKIEAPEDAKVRYLYRTIMADAETKEVSE